MSVRFLLSPEMRDRQAAQITHITGIPASRFSENVDISHCPDGITLRMEVIFDITEAQANAIMTGATIPEETP